MERRERGKRSPALVITTTTPPAPGALPDQPRIDFEEIAARLDAEIAYPPKVSPFGARIDQTLLRGGNWRHAGRLRHARPEMFVSLSEQIGLPLAVVGAGRIPHLLVAHNLTTARRRAFQRRTRYLERFDRILVLSRGQESYLREETAVRPDRIRFVYDKVDHRFFLPSETFRENGYVLSVGYEQRDYETLVKAVAALGVPTVLVASSLWNPTHEIATAELPGNVAIRHDLSFRELRALYDGAALVVVPIRAGVDYAAGVNAVMEAMAMRKPVIVSRTPGLAGYVDDGVTGREIAPEDPGALAEAIHLLLQDGAGSWRLARSARAVVEGGRNLDTYVDAVVGAAREMVAGSQPS